jgi:hypothetical protein
LLVFVALAVLVGGSPLSLDWSREHTAATKALPLASPSGPDGLVRIEANGLTFRARVAGLWGEGPGVILLHGFPETSAMWEPLFAALWHSGPAGGPWWRSTSVATARARDPEASMPTSCPSWWVT